METTVIQFAENSWKSIYKLGATSALLAVVVGVLEIVITFLPGGERVAPELMTVSGWFVRFQVNPLMEMRNLGLINIFLTAFGIPLFLALFAAHRRVDPGFASLAMLLSFVGAAVFFATNRAFAMYSLSEQYAAATTRAGIEAASSRAKPDKE